jgi:hypothetical protein
MATNLQTEIAFEFDRKCVYPALQQQYGLVTWFTRGNVTINKNRTVECALAMLQE